MNRKTLVLPALAGLLVPTLAACGSSDGSGDGGKPIKVGTTAQLEATKDAPAPLDPAQAYDVDAWNVLRGTLQTLMRLPRTGTAPVPEAAESCGFRDTQSEQYRCKLRDGLKFTNGHALTSKDVKFSIDRMLAIKYDRGPVSLVDNVDKVETPSESEVVFHLKKPDATFPQKLATPAAAIVDSEVYPKNGLYKGFEVAGSGPYTVKVEHSGERVSKAVFTKNPEYKGGIEVKNSTVEMKFFDDSEGMEKALRKGDIDLMNRSLAPDQIKGLENARDEHVRLQAVPGSEIRYLAFNTDNPSVSDKAVRQAMAQLINRSALVRDVYSYTGDPLYSMVPKGLTGHINSFFTKYGSPSVPAARKILQQAHINTPVKLTLTYTTNHYGSSTAKEFKTLQSQLNQGGLFDVSLKGVDSWQQFRKEQTEGKYAAYGMGWFADLPDADNYIAPFFGKGNVLNNNYDAKRITSKLLPGTAGQPDRQATKPAFREMQDIVAEDLPVIPIWQGKQYAVAGENIAGLQWTLDASTVFRFWEISKG
ncbi:ABC transporter substrate-binding protein [Streptomyces peucetius]|uniref:ABC transporter substrate-binding protein n=1 Tax=Streptomyces peucetius TaxID=1950 RepID=UPI0004CC9902|nr:ABC transporter substrate-binding protein [Streptomyces peucetius]